MSDDKLFDEIIALAKRRGFVYPSSEIYGGFAAVYDYGPYGAELEKNVREAWWQYMVQFREDIVGLDSSIVMHPKIWEASGHVSGFSDPLVECKNCHFRMRVDHLLEDIGVFADEKMSEEDINRIFSENKEKIKCLKCGKQDFSDVKKFNLLVKSNLGNFSEDWNKDPVYLRGETCQGIYVNYKNVVDTTRVKVPFGIAQIGKAYRNEITARQFIFRTREFEQMEMQYFTHPDKELEEYEKLKEYRWDYYIDFLKIKKDNLKWSKHENLVFYAKEAYDIEYRYPFGFKELEGVHARGDYDLTQHSQFSGKKLDYMDPYTQERYVPHIIESSVGVGRTVLALICDAYEVEKLENGKERTVMKFPRKMAPVKAAIFPLQKDDKLADLAKDIFDDLKQEFMCEYDNAGNIGKMYRRQDEIGTPFCVTVDYDSLEDNKVTVRDRDTMEQVRVEIDGLEDWIEERL